MNFANLQEFIEYYKIDALAFNLSKEEPQAYSKLESLKNKLESSDIDDEVIEVQEHAKLAFKEAKRLLETHYQLKNYLATYNGRVATFLLYLRLYLEYFNLYKRAIEELNPAINQYKSHPFKNKILFKVGLLFADGSMEKYYNHNKTGIKEGYSASKIAEELGDKSYNKFILASMNNYPPSNSNANKNIFNSLDKMRKIMTHCNELQIEVIEDFTKRLPLE